MKFKNFLIIFILFIVLLCSVSAISASQNLTEDTSSDASMEKLKVSNVDLDKSTDKVNDFDDNKTFRTQSISSSSEEQDESNFKLSSDNNNSVIRGGANLNC